MVAAGNVTRKDLHHIEMQLVSCTVNAGKGASDWGFEDSFGGCAVGSLAVLMAFDLPSVWYQSAENIATQLWHSPWLNNHDKEAFDLRFVSTDPTYIHMLPWKQGEFNGKS